MTGVTFNAAAVILPAGTRLRLLRDRILIRPLDWTPSRIITVIRRGRPLRGVIEAVGPGRYYRRYSPHPTDSRKRQYSESTTFIRTDVKVGDVVELGGLNAYDGQGYNFPQVTIGTETFLIAQEQDVCFVDETERCCEKSMTVQMEGRSDNPPKATVVAAQVPLLNNRERDGQSVEHHG